MSSVNPPPFQIIPQSLRQNPDVYTFHQNTQTVIRQLYDKVGGQTDPIADTVETVQALSAQVSEFETQTGDNFTAQGALIQSNADNIQDNTEDIAQVNIDAGLLSNRVTALEIGATEITEDYSTISTANLFCNNTSAITITLNIAPVDGEKLVIKTINTGTVNITGNVDGSAVTPLSTQYDTLTIMAFNGAWYQI